MIVICNYCNVIIYLFLQFDYYSSIWLSFFKHRNIAMQLKCYYENKIKNWKKFFEYLGRFFKILWISFKFTEKKRSFKDCLKISNKFVLKCWVFSTFILWNCLYVKVVHFSPEVSDPNTQKYFVQLFLRYLNNGAFKTIETKALLIGKISGNVYVFI